MFDIIKKIDIEKSLETNHRQYLVGDLKLPQELNHIFDSDIEVGITHFKEYAAEKPHFHPIATEYQVILSGEAKFIDLDKNEEILLQAGDFFVIRPNTSYIQKSPEGTKILFFKHPAGNDKTLIEMTEKLYNWCSDWSVSW